MTTHLFGAVSSPSCANFALRKTAADNQADFSNEAVRTVDRNFYVDDCLKSVDLEENAIHLSSELSQLLKRGGFRLTKWLSNKRKVVEAVSESDRAASGIRQSFGLRLYPCGESPWGTVAGDFRHVWL